MAAKTVTLWLSKITAAKLDEIIESENAFNKAHLQGLESQWTWDSFVEKLICNYYLEWKQN